MKAARIISVIIIIMTTANIIKGSCPKSHHITIESPGIPDCAAYGIVARYWCLASGTENNNGSNTKWLKDNNIDSCYFKGDLQTSGVQGCCGMWEKGFYNSKMLMAILEDPKNENLFFILQITLFY